MKIQFFLVILLFSINSINKAQTINFPDIDGWKKNEEIKKYNADNLWDLIDGAADIFLKFEFIELTVAEYDNSQSYINVEVYRHKSLSHAYGIYMQEKPLHAKTIAIGAEGYCDKSILNFFIENYYIKLSSHNADTSTQQVMMAISIKLASIIATSPKLPVLLTMFPAINKVEQSEQFVSKDFLGYEYMSDFFIANYFNNNIKFTVFIAQKSTPQECTTMIKKYMEQCNYKKEVKNGKYILNDKYNGTVSIEVNNEFCWGIKGINDTKLVDEYLLLIKNNLIKQGLLKLE